MQAALKGRITDTPRAKQAPNGQDIATARITDGKGLQVGIICAGAARGDLLQMDAGALVSTTGDLRTMSQGDKKVLVILAARITALEDDGDL